MPAWSCSLLADDLLSDAESGWEQHAIATSLDSRMTKILYTGLYVRVDCFDISGVAARSIARCTSKLRVLPKGSAAATDYAAFLKSFSGRDLAALRVPAGLGAQAVTGYLRWPKASSGHNAAGSYLHGEADQYALDINRGGGDFDLGDDVLSARSGDVIQHSAYTTVGSYGNYLVIRHGNSYTTHYAHLSAMHVTQGSYVTTQRYIGNVENWA